MWIFAAFVAVPLIEIGLFIQVGGLIGLWPTLALVLLTAVIGTALVRAEGARAMADLRRAMHDLRDPTAPLAHGAMILLAGALLLTPGFFTDTMGILLLIPQVRARVMRWLAKRVQVASFTMGPGPAQPRDRNVIDGDFHEIDPENHPSQGPSGWTRH
ncbi:FxsA family protein [Phaeovulum sp.]|uniref:FxsA family protein n=1 Tax=Phaeovulum sp. TaxID=2934796 RepID=UPI0039E39D34